MDINILPHMLNYEKCQIVENLWNFDSQLLWQPTSMFWKDGGAMASDIREAYHPTDTDGNLWFHKNAIFIVCIVRQWHRGHIDLC